MSLFKEEKPHKTVKLSELYPELADDDAIEVDVEFDIFRAGQRTFRRHWLRISRRGRLPEVLSGTSEEDQEEGANRLGRDFMKMLSDSDGFNDGVELVALGIVHDVRRFPVENGDGVSIVEALSGLPEDEREPNLRGLLDGDSDLLVALLGASLKAEVEYSEEAKAKAKKSSASSRAKRAKPTRKSAG